MIPLFKVFMAPFTGQSLADTLKSGYIGEGPLVKSFETMIGAVFQSEHVLAVNSASSGLEMAVRMVADRPGDEILTTALTCTATNWPIVHQGLKPVWVDVEPSTLNMDLDDLETKLSWNTAAVMLTHWGGRPHDMDKLARIQAQYLDMYGSPLRVIEDCAHSFGSFYRKKPLGTFGDFGVYSFQAVKPLTCGDGGCLIVKDPKEYQRAKLMRWYGIDRDNRDADVMEAGFKYHMNDIAANIGLNNCVGALQNVKKQINNACKLYAWLIGTPGVELLEFPGHDHSWWLFTILVDRREDFIRAMKDRGIECAVVHKRNDKYSCMKEYSSDLPRLDSIETRYVNIPVGWWLSDEDLKHITRSIKQGW